MGFGGDPRSPVSVEVCKKDRIYTAGKTQSMTPAPCNLAIGVRGLPFMKILLLMNLGAFVFGFIRVYVVDQPGTVVKPTPPEGGPGCCAHCAGARNSYSDDRGKNGSNHSDYKVPNIVHYIWFNTEHRMLHFHHMLSILSAHKVLQPDKIYFHTNMVPNGPYWERVKNLPNFVINKREPPLEAFGEKIKEPMFYTSHSNVDRVKILMEYGGIYLDFDMFIIRPFDELRKHECTIGLEQETKACGSVIICSKDAFFLTMWMNSYFDDYRIEEWAYNTGQVPANIAKRFPHLIHVEKMKLNRPNFKELDVLWGPKTFDWRQNYAVHLWYRIWKDMSPYYTGEEPDPENIKTMNNTFGQIARSIYYGTSALIPKDNF